MKRFAPQTILLGRIQSQRVVEVVERRERSGRERGTRKESMTSGAGLPEKVFTGPWDPYAEGADLYDHERGGEETLPLIDVDSEAKEPGETNPFSKGPWYDPSYNPFLQDVWTPSFDSLAMREKNNDKFNVDTLFDVPIIPSSVFQKNEHPVFMSDNPEVTIEPSHVYGNLCLKVTQFM